MSWDDLAGEIIPEPIEHADPEIFSFLWSIFQLFSFTKLNPIAQCSGITLRAEGLYESAPFTVCTSGARGKPSTSFPRGSL